MRHSEGLYSVGQRFFQRRENLVVNRTFARRVRLAVAHGFGVPLTVAAIAGVIVTAVIRVLAVVFDLSLPEQRMLYRRRVAAETGAMPIVKP